MDNNDMPLQAGLDQVFQKTLCFCNQSGQEYWLNMVDGKLETGGNLPMTEAAEIFFKEVKRIADHYTSVRAPINQHTPTESHG